MNSSQDPDMWNRAPRPVAQRVGESGRYLRSGSPRSSQNGSVVLFVLFICLGLATLVQILSVVAICVDRGALAEASGRARLEEKDSGLATMRRQATRTWTPTPWTLVVPGSGQVEGTLADLPESAGWELMAAARQAPEVSPVVVSARLERARDGLDLPLAGLVAATVGSSPDRTSACVEIEPGAAAQGSGDGTGALPVGYFQTPPPPMLLGLGVVAQTFAGPWRLDAGWLAFFQAEATMRSGSLQPGDPAAATAGTDGLAAGPQVVVLVGDGATTVRLPDGCGTSPDTPALIVLVGGATLDARGRGELHGVVVVDGGGALLSDTRVHGAVFVTGMADFGSSGAVVFTRSVLRWATDASLARTRLVPGTRSEHVE